MHQSYQTTQTHTQKHSSSVIRLVPFSLQDHWNIVGWRIWHKVHSLAHARYDLFFQWIKLIHYFYNSTLISPTLVKAMKLQKTSSLNQHLYIFFSTKTGTWTKGQKILPWLIFEKNNRCEYIWVEPAFIPCLLCFP